MRIAIMVDTEEGVVDIAPVTRGVEALRECAQFVTEIDEGIDALQRVVLQRHRTGFSSKKLATSAT